MFAVGNETSDINQWMGNVIKVNLWVQITW